MTQTTTLVLADYDRRRLERNAEAFEAAGYRVVRAQGGKSALDHVANNAATLLIAEAFLPEGNGIEIATRLSGDRRTQTTRALVFLDSGDSYGRQRAEEAGVRTLVRPFTAEEMVASVQLLEAEGPLTTASARPTPSLIEDMASGARGENPVLKHITDPVTGLWNAPYTSIKLAEEIKRARRFGTPLSVIALGFDGSAIADDASRKRLSTEVAGVLLCETRDIDHLGRGEGDGFLIILPHTDAQGASVMANRVISTIDKRGMTTPSSEGTATMSAGIAGFSADLTPAPEDLIAHAEAALDQSRRFGGNRLSKWSAEGALGS